MYEYRENLEYFKTYKVPKWKFFMQWLFGMQDLLNPAFVECFHEESSWSIKHIIIQSESPRSILIQDNGLCFSNRIYLVINNSSKEK
jgi:hypothetical protein